MKKITLFILLLILLPVPLRSAAAQEESETLTLRFTRDWGYGGMDGQIQGRFSLRVSAPPDLIRVDFIIDGQIVHTVTEPPFDYQFDTSQYAPGVHTLTAIGYKADGAALFGTEYVRHFITADEAKETTMKLIGPLLILVGGATVAGIVAPLLFGRKKAFKPGVYGVAGGAVCPRCSFPYSRRLLAPNLLVGKLERCPHCGKWAIVPAASPDALQAAEERWLREGTSEVAALSDDEKMKQMLDESRYHD